MLTPKINLIMFNMSTFYDWDRGVVNRNYNVLKTLEKDPRIEKIVAVDFLPRGWKKAITHYIKNILIEVKTANLVYGDLTSACYQRSDKIYTYTTIDSVFSLKTITKELRRIEKILNLKNIVFWSYNPMITEFIGKLNEKLLVFDTVDNWLEHPGYKKMMRLSRLLRNYKILSEKADLIFTVSEEMKSFYKTFNRTKDVYCVPNGVDFAHFNDPNKINRPNLLTSIDKPILGYLGTIQERVDIDLLVKVAKTHKDKVLVLAGPIWPKIKRELHHKTRGLNNIKMVGRVKFDDAPSYVNRFDVAIIPHKINKFVKSMDPMKMYDYLACGKPIVATNSSDFSRFKEFIYLADTADQFNKAIDQALKEDSETKQAARHAAVKSHSWENRVGEMTKLLFEKIKR